MTASSFRQGRTCDNAGAMNTPTDLRSPYQPPNADLTGPPQVLPPLQEHERSGAPKVFGVLSIIFASIVLLSSSLGMLATLATSAATSMGKMVPDPEKAAEVTTMMQPMAKVYQGIGLQSAILFVMSALLLAIGIGQLRYRAWAQRWSVYWGAAGLACVGLMVAISLLHHRARVRPVLRVDVAHQAAGRRAGAGAVDAADGGMFGGRSPR